MSLKKKIFSFFPLDRLVRWYLRTSGKEYLIRFIDGLSNLGRPSSVFFPPELFEQGLSLVLSGLNNTLSIQSNPHWVWPLWVERQQDPDGEAFIPTGVNLVMGNLSRRDWTAIGIRGSQKEGMVDPVGMVTSQPFGWSVLPFLQFQGESYLPPRLEKKTKQRLRNQTDPVVITEYNVSPNLGWECEAQALLTGGEELICLTQRLQNRSKETLKVTVGFGLRPYNMLTIGHINKIKFKNRLWRINKKPALLLPTEPDRCLASGGERQDPILGSQEMPQVTKLRRRSGLLIGQAEYDYRLAPGDEVELVAVIPMGKQSMGQNNQFATLSLKALKKAKYQATEFWQKNNRRGIQLTLPDVAFQEAFGAVKNHLHVYDDGDHFTAGTFFYHFQWLRDSAYLALAFENMGFAEDVDPKVAGFLSLQTKEGFFRSQDGEWDGAGQAITTLVRHFLRSGDTKGLEQHFPALYKGALWIEEARQETKDGQAPHAGLLPAGISAEHFGPNDHYFWDNFWGLAALRDLSKAAQMIGRNQTHKTLEQLAEGYQERLAQVMGEACQSNPEQGLPCSIYRPLDTAAIGTLVSLWPLDLFSPFDPWVGPTLDYLWENNLRDGLFYQKIIHTGLNVYLSAQLAEAFLARGDQRAWVILASILAHGGPTHVWPEAIHPQAHGGCMGDGDHGWAAAEFVNLVRNLLVKEQENELLLGLGIRSEWLEPGKRIELQDAPTDFGILSYELIGSIEHLEIKWELKRGPGHSPTALFLLLPKGSVEADRWGIDKVRVALDGDVGRLKIGRELVESNCDTQKSA